MSSLVFLFASQIPDLHLRKLATEQQQQNPNKSLLFLAKGLSKGQPSKTKDFQSITTLQPNITENTVAPPPTLPAKAKQGAKRQKEILVNSSPCLLRSQSPQFVCLCLSSFHALFMFVLCVILQGFLCLEGEIRKGMSTPSS